MSRLWRLHFYLRIKLKVYVHITYARFTPMKITPPHRCIRDAFTDASDSVSNRYRAAHRPRNGRPATRVTKSTKYEPSMITRRALDSNHRSPTGRQSAVHRPATRRPPIGRRIGRLQIIFLSNTRVPMKSQNKSRR